MYSNLDDFLFRVVPSQKSVRGRCHNQQQLSKDQRAPHHSWRNATPSLGARHDTADRAVKAAGDESRKNKRHQIAEPSAWLRPFSWLSRKLPCRTKCPLLHGFRRCTIRPSPVHSVTVHSSLRRTRGQVGVRRHRLPIECLAIGSLVVSIVFIFCTCVFGTSCVIFGKDDDWAVGAITRFVIFTLSLCAFIRATGILSFVVAVVQFKKILPTGPLYCSAVRPCENRVAQGSPCQRPEVLRFRLLRQATC